MRSQLFVLLHLLIADKLTTLLVVKHDSQHSYDNWYEQCWHWSNWNWRGTIAVVCATCVDARTIYTVVIRKRNVLTGVEHVSRTAEPSCADNTSPDSSSFDAELCWIHCAFCWPNYQLVTVCPVKVLLAVRVISWIALVTANCWTCFDPHKQ
jgi:hypothetical protein